MVGRHLFKKQHENVWVSEVKAMVTKQIGPIGIKVFFKKIGSVCGKNENRCVLFHFALYIVILKNLLIEGGGKKSDMG